ncbi:glycosyltransferase [Candidatus Cetobacterium colombiensis]|uniref:Glycosyltransferase n=1 Tax=Candidatus Cetobacterium colombiensis TaxID=3073100 RepID=A0ABU4WEZ0_9FUSO|nr:glycosyltransferase [Candidatus Cetobacterium colombiensis]MDX8337058.1 glycosyltransferase [Candidatus Cetobacterium colombiensis]
MEKKIHYVWLGKNPKPNIMDICINSWREKLPDYEIIEWNEENLNFYEEIEKNRFLKECYNRKLWAFLSDYFRVKVLYDQGGIYLDSDMQIIKNLDIFLENEMFLGKEDKKQASAGIIGAKKQHPFFKKMLDFYEKDIWNINIYTIPAIIQYILKKDYGFLEEISGIVKLRDGIIIYPSEYFYPYHFTEEFSYDKIKNNTYGIHWWGKSWHGNNKKLYFLEFKTLKGYKKIVVNTLIFLNLLEPVRKIYEKFIKK